jgi:hypothetical protein
MSSLICRSGLGSLPRDIRKLHKIRMKALLDSVNRIVHCNVQKGKVTRRMNGGRSDSLRLWECLVPLNYRVHRLRCFGI